MHPGWKQMYAKQRVCKGHSEAAQTPALSYVSKVGYSKKKNHKQRERKREVFERKGPISHAW